MIRRKGKRSFSILGAWLKVFIDIDANDDDDDDGDNGGSLSPKK